MTTVKGIDVSEYQGPINWTEVAAAGYHFVAIRSGQGNNKTDARFYINWQGAKDAGLLTSVYHVVFPSQPADSQMDHFFSLLAGRTLDFPPVLDVELHHHCSNATISACVQKCVQIIHHKTGCYPIIYTRKSFWDPYLNDAPEWTQCPLWVANYRPPTSTPLMPNTWNTWTFWQYSEEGQVPGINTHTTDLDLFSGTLADLRALGPVETDGSVPLEETFETQTLTNLPKARVSVTGLEIRNGPSVNYDSLGTLDLGAVVDIQAVGGNHAWVEIEPGRWSAFVYDGAQYMTNLPLETNSGLQAKVQVTDLKIRCGPDVSYESVGTLQPGKVVTISAVDGKNAWVKIGPGQWAAFSEHGHRYMTNEAEPAHYTLTKVLTLGAVGLDVEMLQTVLKQQEYYTKAVNGIFDEATETAVRAFQATANITVDGEVGPETCRALGWQWSGDRSQCLQLADLAETEGEQGLLWESGYCEAEKYLAPLRQPMIERGQIDPGPINYKWCAAFVTWCCRQVGFDIPDAPENYFATMALVTAWKVWGQQKGYWHCKDTQFVPQRGDILLFDWGGNDSLDHIGIVRKYTPGSTEILTAEGNVGNKTANLSRSLSTVAGYIRIT